MTSNLIALREYQESLPTPTPVEHTPQVDLSGVESAIRSIPSVDYTKHMAGLRRDLSAIGENLGKITQALTALASRPSDAPTVNVDLDGLRETMEDTAEAVRDMAAAYREPRTIVEDNDGKPVGVKIG